MKLLEQLGQPDLYCQPMVVCHVKNGLRRLGKCRWVLDHPSRFLLCQTQLIKLLMVHPEFGAACEKVSPAQSLITGCGALSVQGRGYAVCWYLKLTGQLGCAHAKRFI